MAPYMYYNDKKEVVSWRELMSLDQIGKDVYQSRVQPYQPTGGGNGAFGGHVYAQSVWAAAQTVEPGFLVHNVTGWFLMMAKPRKPFVFTVQRVRDGYGYVTRTVTVIQEPDKGPSFTCTCSFKRAEPSTSPNVQDPEALKQRFSTANVRWQDPMAHEPAPSVDDKGLVKKADSSSTHFNPIPGLHMRKANMDDYNASRHAIDQRRLTFYSLRGSLPPPYQLSSPVTPPSQIKATSSLPVPDPSSSSSPPPKTKISSRAANLHAAAHLYASDRNSALTIINSLGVDLASVKTLASLAHTVIFHAGVEHLAMPDEPVDLKTDARADPTSEYIVSEMEVRPDGQIAGQVGGSMQGSTGGSGIGHAQGRDKGRWFLQEMWTTRVSDGRGIHTSRLFDVQSGVHVATTIQDVIARLKPDAKL